MIIPEKYTDFNTSIISVAAYIIKTIKDNGPMTYNAVLKSVQVPLGENSKVEFKNALSFLYLLGKIEYYSENDILELRK